ncbi:MAG: hypothetical protein Q7W55_02370 [Pseudohongiella sp.]|nr:hypothetical protein [Pseudohongiella sp.]
MRTQTLTKSNSTDHVVANSLEASESYYLEIRAKLSQTGDLIAKYRKTCEASKEESILAANEWKNALVSSGGEVSKDIRELKRRELIARETEQEFRVLIDELQPNFSDLQILTCQLRASYVANFNRVESIRIKETLDAAAESVFSTDEGKEFAALLLHVVNKEKSILSTDILVQELASVAPSVGISVDEAESEMTTRRVQNFVYQFIERHCRAAYNSSVFGEQRLPIPRLPFELHPKQSSAFAASGAASRLKALGVIA